MTFPENEINSIILASGACCFCKDETLALNFGLSLVDKAANVHTQTHTVGGPHPPGLCSSQDPFQCTEKVNYLQSQEACCMNIADNP